MEQSAYRSCRWCHPPVPGGGRGQGPAGGAEPSLGPQKQQHQVMVPVPSPWRSPPCPPSSPAGFALPVGVTTRVGVTARVAVTALVAVTARVGSQPRGAGGPGTPAQPGEGRIREGFHGWSRIPPSSSPQSRCPRLSVPPSVPLSVRPSVRSRGGLPPGAAPPAPSVSPERGCGERGGGERRRRRRREGGREEEEEEEAAHPASPIPAHESAPGPPLGPKRGRRGPLRSAAGGWEGGGAGGSVRSRDASAGAAGAAAAAIHPRSH